jgi:hypothetical protein
LRGFSVQASCPSGGSVAFDAGLPANDWIQGVVGMGNAPKLRIASERPASALLAMIERLKDDLDDCDLDRIDGEFFWLWCHREAMPLIEEMREIKASGAVRYRSDFIPDQLGFVQDMPSPEALQGTWWPFEDEESSQTYTRFMELWRSAESVLPGDVVGALVAGKPVRMRPPRISLHTRYLGGELDWYVLILVQSTAVSGTVIEQSLELAVEEFGIEREELPMLTLHRVNAEYVLVREASELKALLGHKPDRATELPCIAVVAPLPLCSKGAVGREYDAAVRDQHRWHLLLPDANETRQEKDVALRTWGVGLLLRHGERFGAAMRRVCEAGPLQEVSQSRFNVDRQALLKRVPEAAPFLMQRQNRAEGLQTA